MIGLPLNPEERRFYRLIEERETNQDGTEDVLLACGHTLTYVRPVPAAQTYAPCMECVDAWIEAEKRK